MNHSPSSRSTTAGIRVHHSSAVDDDNNENKLPTLDIEDGDKYFIHHSAAEVGKGEGCGEEEGIKVMDHRLSLSSSHHHQSSRSIYSTRTPPVNTRSILSQPLPATVRSVSSPLCPRCGSGPCIEELKLSQSVPHTTVNNEKTSPALSVRSQPRQLSNQSIADKPSPSASASSLSHRRSLSETPSFVLPSNASIASTASAASSTACSSSSSTTYQSTSIEPTVNPPLPHKDPTMNIYTWSEIKKHNHPESVWLVVRGVVYDVTNFIRIHPGGIKSILKHAGTEASEHYDFHSRIARKLWKACEIGRLYGYMEPKKCIIQ